MSEDICLCQKWCTVPHHFDASQCTKRVQYRGEFTNSAPTMRTTPPGVPHELKSWPDSFKNIWDGLKTYDVRKDDRVFIIGDKAKFREFQPHDPLHLEIEGYTGRELIADIVYKTPGGNWGLPAGLCVIGLRVVDRYAATEVQSMSRPENAS